MSKIIKEIDSYKKPIDEMNEKEFGKYVDGINAQACKLIARYHNHASDNMQTVEALIDYMTRIPACFAFAFTVGQRDMLKWSIDEKIKLLKKFSKTIAKIEKDFNLPLEYDDSEQPQ